MEKQQAIDIARKHIEENNKELVGEVYKYIVSKPVEYEKFWYFDYEYEVTESVSLAGAPGFIVNKKTGECEVMLWHQYFDIKNIKKSLEELLKEVNSKDSFFIFINALEVNRRYEAEHDVADVPYLMKENHWKIDRISELLRVISE